MSSRFLAFSFALTAVTATSSTSGWGGNWSGGGGGEIIEHAQNPWFLDAPAAGPVVKYCIESAPDFAVPLHALEGVVGRAFDWWRDQFSNAYYPPNKVTASGVTANFTVIVNTTRYRKGDCGNDTDLRFQFGKLSADQASEFERLKVDLTRYVALTVRTDYSDNLHGKGFIYVSPDRGMNAFRGQNVLPEAWTVYDTYYTRLTSVVTHELGHVFGLGHSQQADSIMGSRFAETVVARSHGTNVWPSILQETTFFPKVGEVGGDQHCGLPADYHAFREFFQVPDDLTCFRARLSLNHLIVEAKSKSDSGRWQELGRATFADGGERRHQQLVTLWIPQTQTAIRGLPSFVTSLLGPASTEVQHAATFQFADRSPGRLVFVQASPRYVQIGGVKDSKIIPDLLPAAAHGRAVSGWSSR